MYALNNCRLYNVSASFFGKALNVRGQTLRLTSTSQANGILTCTRKTAWLTCNTVCKIHRTFLENIYCRSLIVKNLERNLAGCRFYSTKNKDDDSVDVQDEQSSNFGPQLPAAVAVPEVWPHVPVIAISKNLVFPRFLKLIEVWYITHR